MCTDVLAHLQASKVGTHFETDTNSKIDVAAL